MKLRGSFLVLCVDMNNMADFVKAVDVSIVVEVVLLSVFAVCVIIVGVVGLAVLVVGTCRWLFKTTMMTLSVMQVAIKRKNHRAILVWL